MSWQPDPSLLQDFLTEASELIERLDADLVRLEACGDSQARTELLNSIFRALHTVKGAAGFLQINVLIRFAHAAEDALNRLRQGDVAIAPAIADALLKSADVLRTMVGQLADGNEPTPCDESLINTLHAIAENPGSFSQTPHSSAKNTNAVTEQASSQSVTLPFGITAGEQVSVSEKTQQCVTRPLTLPEQKLAIVDLMICDLQESSVQIDAVAMRAKEKSARNASGRELEEQCEAMRRSIEFFELSDMATLFAALTKSVANLGAMPETTVEWVLSRLGIVMLLVREQALAMESKQAKIWPLDLLTSRLSEVGGGICDSAWLSDEQRDNDIISLGIDVSAFCIAGIPNVNNADATAASATVVTNVERPHPESDKQAEKPAERVNDKTLPDQTVRVEVSRLETLLSLVGQLVLTKNRVLALNRKLRALPLGAPILGDVSAAAGELDRLTSELQVGVMRTRMQPLAKLFDRYPRVIRDIARITGKEIKLELCGKDTEVDKSVLELLADPLVHMIRNSADHGIESADKRIAAGKPAAGTIKVTAEHQGSHVRIEVTDDGKGIDPEAIKAKALEKGLITAEAAVSMPREEALQLIFAPGFSTAEQVTDLSGRGVGMDVVRTNVAKMGGSVDVTSELGKGSRVEIIIPLTVAIMPAMVVGVAGNFFCVPLQTIIEIVRPQESLISSVGGQQVMRLRDRVVPLVDLRSVLEGDTDSNEDPARFAVIVGSGSNKVGLMVHRLVGQQEIVIRPLDDEHTQGGPFSGATIREEGDVSLILDVNQVLRRWQNSGKGGRSAA